MILPTYGPVGTIHLFTAILALIFGTMILLMKKGTRRHKITGYGYVISMTLMLITSFMIYRLFNGFGIFHIFSVLATLTIAGGMVPAILRKPADWFSLHFNFMYWSVIGLYAAFVSEVMTRVPETPFFGMMGIAMFFVFGLGYWGWFRNKGKWSEQFRNLSPKKKHDQGLSTD